MEIEYDIFGRESFIVRELADNEEIIEQAQLLNENQLRRDGVFGEITHDLLDRGEIYPTVTLWSKGKRFLKEVNNV
jgi:hypothetical protein